MVCQIAEKEAIDDSIGDDLPSHQILHVKWADLLVTHNPYVWRVHGSWGKLVVVMRQNYRLYLGLYRYNGCLRCSSSSVPWFEHS